MRRFYAPFDVQRLKSASSKQPAGCKRCRLEHGVMAAMNPQTVLVLVQLRRNLKGTLKTATQAVENIETTLAALTPVCESCLFDRALVRECQCEKSSASIAR